MLSPTLSEDRKYSHPSLGVLDVQQCSLRASACFSDTPLPFLHTEPQPLHIDNTTALGIETSSTDTPTTPHKHILVCLLSAAIIALTYLGYKVPILPLLATWNYQSGGAHCDLEV